MDRELAFDIVVQTLRTADVFVRASRRLFRPHGLGEAQFNVLNVLARAEAGLSQSEIGEMLVVDRSNITGLVDRMEQTGWVKREATPGDRRAWRVSLTARGRAVWEKVFPDYERAVREAVGSLGVERTRVALEVMKRLEKQAEAIGLERDVR